jgi:hypothetical protein
MRRLRGRPLLFGTVTALVATSAVWAATSTFAQPTAAVSGYQVVPRPHCGAGGNPETGFQGEVPLADRAAGFAGFSCNLKKVGAFPGEGSSWQVAWYGRCAYYDTANGEGYGPGSGYTPSLPATGVTVLKQKHLGTVVLDVSRPSRPRATKYLRTPGMLHPWEDLKVNQKRGLLAGAPQGEPPFDVYDVKGNCARPRLLASVPMPSNGHEGEWEPDGRTYWGGGSGDYHAIDVTDPTHPREIFTWTPPNGGSHGLSFSDDGDTAYVCAAPAGEQDGIAILDISSINHRAKHKRVRVIGTIGWNDSSICQMSYPFTAHRHHYLLMTSEQGSASLTHQTNSGCAKGLLPFGIPRIINIDNPKKPVLVANITLQTDEPANCLVATQEVDDQVIFGYDSHYCSLDRERNATAIACGFFNSGIRVFDIRNPARPREIAYYNPHAMISASPVGDGSFGGANPALAGSEHLGSKDADWCSNRSRWYHAPNGAWQLWTTCQDNGFMVLQFTNGAYPLR